MRFWRGLKRGLIRLIPACVLLALAGYFWSNTHVGDPAHDPQVLRQQALQQRRAELGTAEAERAVWQRRVAALRTQSLDRDLLDERARAMLNWSGPNDMIFYYPPGQKLF
jgi:cell division protein FtsB